MAKRSCLRAGLRQRHCGLAGIPEKKISIPSAHVLHRSCTQASCGVTGGKARPGGNLRHGFGCGLLVRFFWRANTWEVSADAGTVILKGQ
jgi:hypothetical protein